MRPPRRVSSQLSICFVERVTRGHSFALPRPVQFSVALTNARLTTKRMKYGELSTYVPRKFKALAKRFNQLLEAAAERTNSADAPKGKESLQTAVLHRRRERV